MEEFKEFVSPVYNMTRIPIDDIVSQKINPNSQSVKSFDALTMSIFNTGYTSGVIAGFNADYDPSTEGKQRPSLLEHSDGIGTFVSGEVKIGTQVSNDEVAKYFPYRLIDGSHRSQVMRLGKYWFENGYDDSDNWFDGKNIPQSPGPAMLAYIAWREDFTIPVVLLDIDEDAQMSVEVLQNTARGSHSLDSMKDIVYTLVVRSNMSMEWVSQNLYLDVESIKRMIQLVGLRSAVTEEGTAPDLTWKPEDDPRWKKMFRGYMAMKANNFILKYQREHPGFEFSPRGDAIEFAKELGWNWDEEVKTRSVEDSKDVTFGQCKNCKKNFTAEMKGVRYCSDCAEPRECANPECHKTVYGVLTGDKKNYFCSERCVKQGKPLLKKLAEEKEANPA